jgi:hypothetical protein
VLIYSQLGIQFMNNQKVTPIVFLARPVREGLKIRYQFHFKDVEQQCPIVAPRGDRPDKTG